MRVMIEDSSPDPQQAETIADLTAKLAKMTDVAARAQAELLNARDRLKREGEELRRFAAVPILLQFLPLRDDLVLAISHDKASSEVLTHLLTKIDRILSDAGVTKILALGEKVDPPPHEIVNSALGERDLILAVHQEGFDLAGRVLRPSRVMVGDGTSASKEG